MKNLNFAELNSYAFWAEQMLAGAQLQDVWTNDRYLVLEFYKYRNIWLVCDLESTSPQFVLLQNEAPSINKRPKPVGLFIASHARGLRVEFLVTRPEWGRVIALQVSSRERSCLIELQLVPTSVNVLVTALDHDSKGKAKKISWDKIKELPQLPHPSHEVLEGLEERWLAREEEWWQEQKLVGRASPVAQKSIADFSKILGKKRNALSALEKSLEADDHQKWSNLGEALKTSGTVESISQTISQELAQLLDLRLSKAENMERAFKKAKDSQRKREGTLERIAKLKQEIETLSQPGAELQHEKKQGLKSSGTKSLIKADARGRKLQLAEGLEAICGRSGKDNLAILRQARAWDLWLHLKDYPGAHAIIFREKNKVVPTSEIERTCEWLIRESPAAKGFAWGVKYDVVVAETRFVRPIKGDSLGRVTYQNPTIYTFASKPEKG